MPRDADVIAENSPATTHKHDVVIVGGRCAGAATAYLLASLGHDVAVVERAELPSDTLSTHGFARGGVVQLSRWGLLDDLMATGAPAIRRVTVGSPAGVRTLPVKDRAGVDHLVAPRRTVLDALLLDAARSAGATVHTATAMTDALRAPDGRVTGVAVTPRRAGHPTPRSDGPPVQAPGHIRARHVVGADGLRSSVARAVGAPNVQGWDAGVAGFYAYVDGADWDGFELYVDVDAYAGVFPTHDGAACVWLIRPTALLEPVRRAGPGRAQAYVDALGSASATLAGRVGAGHLASPVRGWVSPPCISRRAHGPGWSLVGDAGCYRDPITGHGITDAFRDAELLACALDSMLRGDETEAAALTRYESERDALGGPILEITERMTRFPSPARFAELQVELSGALDHEATTLASRPALAGLRAASAA